MRRRLAALLQRRRSIGSTALELAGFTALTIAAWTFNTSLGLAVGGFFLWALGQLYSSPEPPSG